MVKDNHKFFGKVAILQRVLTDYRVPFFDQLAESCIGGISVFAGNPLAYEGINISSDVRVADLHFAKNRYFGFGKFKFCWQQGIVSWLCKFKPEVLIVEANPRLISNLLAIYLMKKWNRPVIGWGLGLLDWTGNKLVLSARRKALNMYYRCFDQLISYSSKGVSDYKKLGIDKEKIFVAHNAVSNKSSNNLKSKIEQNPKIVLEWKRRYHLSEKPIVLFVGRLIPQKRVGDLIIACSRIKTNCELIIVGDGVELDSLKILARKIFPKAIFLGQKSGEELAICFTVADIFVLPGSGGLAVQEAMIYGKPVIVASGDGTQVDLVRDGKNGFHVEPGNINSLINAIETGTENRDLLNKMGIESRRIVTEEYNMNNMVQTFIKVLNVAAKN